MTNITNVVNLPADATSDDGFVQVAAAAPRSLVRGETIRFRKGAFPVGRDEGDMLGAELAAYGAARAWQKWSDKKLVNQIVAEDVEFFPEEVTDIDDDGVEGEWALTLFLYLRDLDNGHDYTFLTSSNGGRRAVTSLSSAILNKRRITPGAVPVVRLDPGSFKTQSFGVVARPEFTITGWVDPGGQKLKAAPLRVELDDEIEF